MTSNDFIWLLTGMVFAIVISRFFGLKRDIYAVEIISIFDGCGCCLLDISAIQSHKVGSLGFSTALNGDRYDIRRNGSKGFFGIKTYFNFDDYAPALAAFANKDSLLLNQRRQKWNAHKVFLWAVTARSHTSAAKVLAKGTYPSRKLSETDFSALLKLYRPTLDL